MDLIKAIGLDDPYYYLYFGKAVRPPSYFRLELETPEVGRVVRFDSFSKILSAGMRMGFASGPKAIIDSMDLHVWSYLPTCHAGMCVHDASDVPLSRLVSLTFRAPPSCRLSH